MGYYSVLKWPKAYRSNLSKEEFLEEWEEAKAQLVGTDHEGYLDNYGWNLDCKDNELVCELETDDWYAKHYGDRELARFIANTISDDDYVVLQFTGEDDWKWGYFVSRGSVKELEYVAPVVDGIPLDEFVLNFCNSRKKGGESGGQSEAE